MLKYEVTGWLLTLHFLTKISYGTPIETEKLLDSVGITLPQDVVIN